MKMEGPFGIDIGIIRFGGDRALIYYPLDNIVYEGSINKVMNLLPINMDFPKIIFGLAGLVVPETEILDSLEFISSYKNEYVLCMENKEWLWIKPKGPVVSRWQKKNSNGEVLWSWEGKYFKGKGKLQIPKMITMTSFSPKQQITLYYERIRTNRSIKRGWSRVKIPEGVYSFEL
jgi:hypothetical protein